MRVPEPSGWFTVQASAAINAPLARVWAVLVDLDSYGEWNTFVPAMRSSLQVGSRVTMQVQMWKRFRIKRFETLVTAVDDSHLLAWKTRFPAWILGSERFQVVTSLDADTTRYVTQESFRGLLAPLVQLVVGRNLERGFAAVARDLKARAEFLTP